VFLDVVEHWSQRPEQPVVAIRLIGGAVDGVTEFVETAEQELVLRRVVVVEGGSTDVGPVEDVLHGRVVVALLQDEVEQSLMEQRPGTSYPAICALVAHVGPSSSSPDNYRLRVQYRTTRPI
jgi:hypothetical protein